MKTIHFNAAGAERKKLANRIAEYEGVQAKYLGAPSFAYEAKRCTVRKDGTVETHDEDSALLEFLESLGGVTEPTETAAEPETENATDDEVRRLSISLPAHDMTGRQIENVLNLVESKKTLLKKAIGVDDLPTSHADGKLHFDWFPGGATPEETQAYMALVCGIRNLAMTLNRVNKVEANVPNEKYAFRCFLLRLGMVGEEFKSHRKILLRNLTGSSAFRDGRKKEGAENE